MSEPIWIYKWYDKQKNLHLSTDYKEANEALHSGCFVFGARYREPPTNTELCPWDCFDDTEEEVL